MLGVVWLVLTLLFSLQSIPAGAQVYDSYGQKCNHRFLLNYGFAVEDNRELDGFCPNEVPLELAVSRVDELYERKLEFWLRGEGNNFIHTSETTTAVAPVKRVRVCISNNENTRLLFSLLRALSCNEEELTGITSMILNNNEIVVNRALFTDHHTARPTTTTTTTALYRSCRDIRHPLSLRNEKSAMMLLLDIVGSALAKYPTSLAQDVADLMNQGAFPRFSNARHAKIQVRGEKQVLHHYARWARTALDIMAVMEQELNQHRENTIGVEVQLRGRRPIVSTTDSAPKFELLMREMEQDEMQHHTIVRYCVDVLGSLRREELKKIRRTMMLSSPRQQQDTYHL